MTTPTKDDEEDIDPSDGSVLNARNHIMSVELVEGTYTERLGHHGLNYGNVESMVWMNIDHTEIRFLCTGRKWMGREWREAVFEALIEGKHLGRLYAKLLAGTRAIIRPTMPQRDKTKSQVDRISITETQNITFQDPPEDWQRA